jgi:peptide/nickel transport system substrate-binding protein
MRAHDRGPQFPASWPADVPPDVGTVLQVALTRKPENRYPKATTFWHALNDLEVNAQVAREQAERQAVADQWKAEVAAAMAASEWSAAKMAVGRWLSITPDDPQAQAARQEIERQIEQAASRQKQAEAERAVQAAIALEAARKAEEARARQEADRKAREEQERQRQAELAAQAAAAEKAKQEAAERERQKRATEAAVVTAGAVSALTESVLVPTDVTPPPAAPARSKTWIFAVGAVVVIAIIAVLALSSGNRAGPASAPAMLTEAPVVEIPTQAPAVVEMSTQAAATIESLTQSPALPTEAPSFPPAKDPQTWTYMTFSDPNTLDPSIDYEVAGQGILQGNIYQQLISYDGMSVNTFVPTLAEAIPDPQFNQNGGVQYVWKIRDGVRWASGSPLTAEDVAFGLWRTILNGDPNTPAFLLLEAFFDVDDASQIVVAPDGSMFGDVEGLKQASADKLEQTCLKVKDTVQFDNASRTVTMNLPRAWGPLLGTLATVSASPQEKAWVASQGEWDGDCRTWQNFYGIPAESGKIRDKTNGTGPYQLDHWTPDDEIVLTLNPNYTGEKPAIEHVVIKNVPEFATRFAALQAGDADQIAVGSQADWTQMDTLVREECDYATDECKTVNPSGILRVFKPLLPLSRLDVFFAFQIADDSPYIGSGKLDGRGIPPNFFSDVNVRKAFNYCFDRGTYIKDVQLGEGTQSLAITLPGQPGYDDSPTYEFNLDKCAAAFQASTLTDVNGQSLWDTGFYLQMPYNEGNSGRQASAEILAANLKQVNPEFVLAPVALPWPTYLEAQRAKQLPLQRTGWAEDIHDPHNWYVPYFLTTYASRINLPQDLQDKYKTFIDQGVKEVDPARRAEVYRQLNQMIHDDAALIILSYATARRYEPLYVNGWYGSNAANPLYSPPTGVWALSKQ